MINANVMTQWLMLRMSAGGVAYHINRHAHILESVTHFVKANKQFAINTW